MCACLRGRGAGSGREERLNRWPCKAEGLPGVAWHCPLAEGPHGTEGEGRSCSSSPSSFCLTVRAGAAYLISCPWSGFYVPGSPGLQALGLGPSDTTGCPGSPTHRWEIMGLLSLPSPLLITTLFPQSLSLSFTFLLFLRRTRTRTQGDFPLCHCICCALRLEHPFYPWLTLLRPHSASAPPPPGIFL